MSKIDLSKPMFDQGEYLGRAKHFFLVTNPINLLASDEELDEAKKVVTAYKKSGIMPPGYDEQKLWKSKYLYESAFHPDTGEKVLIIGRMSAQVPMNTLITGCMITFYRSTAATVFWHWVNQSFNAIVNYSNRAGDAPITQETLIASYLAACGGALTTALYLNSKVKGMNPVFARLVPFAAVSGANFINIPMMRSSELMNGIPVFVKNQRVGESKTAAQYSILLVCVSRIIMATPGMILVPLITNAAAKRGLFRKRPWTVIPFQLFLVSLSLVFATPFGCAVFPQQASLPLGSVEPPVQEAAKKLLGKNDEQVVTFNKGL